MNADFIKLVIKRAMKNQGRKYEDLAEHLGVSLVTVRRFMSKEDIGLERLLAICQWLGVSLADVASSAEAQSPSRNFMSEEQEEFFCSFPTYFTYLRLLGRGLTPEQIARQYDLGKPQTERYLLELEQIGVISNGTSVKLAIPWPIQFRFPGPMQRKFFGQLRKVVLDRLTQDSLSKDFQEYPSFFFADSLLLGPDSWFEYRQDMEKLYEKWTSIGRREMRLSDPTTLVPTTSVLGIGAFDALTLVMGAPQNEDRRKG